ncbi:hypothetical protein H0O00_03380 [Candidatus Micrarchaeota archaeon]|nr:hypothetical protein [Candidatus Micrarchaeota archaeon]
MRPVVTFLGIASLLILLGTCFAVEPCVACQEFKGVPQAQLNVEKNDVTHVLEIGAYYENLTTSPIRQNIANTTIIVEVMNLKTNYKWIYRTYTNEEGKATFNFTDNVQGDNCLKMTVLYCPFCKPDDPVCGFMDCLNYSGMSNSSGYYLNALAGLPSADSIPLASGAAVPPELNAGKYVAQLERVPFCPPPPPVTATPGMCLPLLVIFSLLSGALYLTGRNPFTGFNIGGARVGKHIQYQARGRGFSLALATAATSFAQTAVSVGKAAAEGGFKAVVKQEVQAAENRFIGGGFVKAAAGAAALGGALGSAPTKGADGKPLTFSARMGAVTHHMEARISGTGLGGEKGGQQTTAKRGTEAGIISVGGPRGSEIMGKSGILTVAGIGKLTMFVFSQTTIGRTVDGMVSMFQPFGQGRGLFEMAFVSRGERVANDTKVLSDMMAAGGVGYKVPVPGGVATVTGIKQEGNNTLLTLAPEKGSDAKGPVTLTINSQGKITTIDMTITDAAGKPQMVSITADPKGNLIVSTISEKGDLTPLNPSNKEDKNLIALASNACVTALPAGMRVGSDASTLVSNANQVMSDVKNIQASIGIEARKDVSQIESDVNGKLSSKVVDKAKEDAAGRVLADADMPNQQKPAQVVVAVHEAADDSRLAKPGTFVRDIVASTEVKPEYRGQATTALANVIAFHNPHELANMPPEQLKAEVKAQIESNLRANPSEYRAPSAISAEADRIVNNMNFKPVAGAVQNGVTELNAELKGAGLDPAKFSNVTISQLRHISDTGAVIDGGSSATIVMLDPNATMNNSNISNEVKCLLAEREHTLNTLNAAGNMGEALKNGNVAAAASLGYRAVQENARSTEARISAIGGSPEMQAAAGPQVSRASNELMAGVQDHFLASRAENPQRAAQLEAEGNKHFKDANGIMQRIMEEKKKEGKT